MRRIWCDRVPSDWRRVTTISFINRWLYRIVPSVEVVGIPVWLRGFGFYSGRRYQMALTEGLKEKTPTTYSKEYNTLVIKDLRNVRWFSLFGKKTSNTIDLYRTPVQDCSGNLFRSFVVHNQKGRIGSIFRTVPSLSCTGSLWSSSVLLELRRDREYWGPLTM